LKLNSRSVRCLRLLLILAGWPAMGAEVDISKLPPAATNKIDFARDIRPILEENCLRCHGPEKPKGQFRLDNRAAALKGGDDGVDILPGDSARSPLIHNVAYLVPDSEMPPIGKGNQLTPAQVSTLRAWIDQGVVWNDSAAGNLLDFAFSPVLGATSLGGDKQKFRELNWQPGGLDGGADHFELFKQLNPDTKLLLNGHALRDDYEINLAIDRSGLGFIHSGWQQYRKYFDDTGGYDPKLIPDAPDLGQDLHLDIGKAWVDVGLTLPDWPRLVLGYEYDYKQGNEATTEWNGVGTNAATARNLGPASERLHETVQTVKLDLDYDYKGWTLEDRFRGEFYHLSTGSTNAGNGQVTENINEGTSYFQGANTFRLDKKFSDWFYASGGYLYSKLNADSTFQLDEPTLLQSAYLPDITLERESNVGNVNARLGPVAGFTLSGGILADYTRQSGLGPGLVDQQSLMPFTNIFVPFTVGSDYNESTVEEDMALRFSKIPFTSVYAEGRWQQQDIGQFDQFSSSEDVLNKAVFTQHTIFDGRTSDLRLGFDTSPWRFVSLSAHYRYDDDDSRYDSSKLVQPSPTAYPTFITARDINTHEFEAQLVLHPSSLFKTTLSYQNYDTAYEVTTRPYELFGSVISPGGELQSAAERGQTVSLSATLTPIRRLYLGASVSYQDSTLTTAADGSPAVVPYQGHTFTLLASGTYVFSTNTDLFAACSFSNADYGQDNYAKGLPLGIEYQRQGAQFGLSRRLGKNASAKLQYRFDYYSEPSSGGANNYVAHSIFAALSFQFR
jgi:mono/diheme cytochrome c family protein